MMIRAIGLMFLFNIPFLLGGAGLIYWGYITEAKSLTDNESPKLIFYVFGGLVISIPLLISLVSIRRAVKKRNRIKEMITYGKQGTAKILKMSDTGVTINDNPRVKLELEISIPNYPTYFAQKTLVIPIINLPQVQPGLTVEVLADPEDKYNEDRIGLILK